MYFTSFPSKKVPAQKPPPEGAEQRLTGIASNQDKKSYERPTSNVQHRILNKVFC